MTRLMLLAVLVAAPTAASTPTQWAALDIKTVAACKAAATELKDPDVGPAVRFSDSFGVDVREVSGTYKPHHMKGAKARMLCIYDRKSGRAEIQEKPSR